MKAISHAEFASLATHSGPSVSIYLPLHTEQRDRLGDEVLLAKAVDQARKALVAIGCSTDTVEQILAPAYSLTEQEAWKTRRHSLAILLGLQTQHILPLDITLAFEVEADRRFHLRPLIPLLVESVHYYLLALSENHVRLYLGDNEGLTELPVAGLPTDLQETVQHESVQRFQGVTSGGTAGIGRHTSTFHGQGGRRDKGKTELHQYVQRVAHAIDTFLGHQTRPLVLATTANIAATWREVAQYSALLPAIVEGCPDYAETRELQDAAWPIVMHMLQSDQCERFEKLSRNKARSLVVDDLRTAVLAACEGRIEIAMMDGSKPIFGCLERSDQSVETYSDASLGDIDLLDMIAVETVKHGGIVYPMSASICPRAAATPGCPITALLRY